MATVDMAITIPRLPTFPARLPISEQDLKTTEPEIKAVIATSENGGYPTCEEPAEKVQTETEITNTIDLMTIMYQRVPEELESLATGPSKEHEPSRYHRKFVARKSKMLGLGKYRAMRHIILETVTFHDFKVAIRRLVAQIGVLRITPSNETPTERQARIQDSQHRQSLLDNSLLQFNHMINEIISSLNDGTRSAVFNPNPGLVKRDSYGAEFIDREVRRMDSLRTEINAIDIKVPKYGNPGDAQIPKFYIDLPATERAEIWKEPNLFRSLVYTFLWQARGAMCIRSTIQNNKKFEMSLVKQIVDFCDGAYLMVLRPGLLNQRRLTNQFNEMAATHRERWNKEHGARMQLGGLEELRVPPNCRRFNRTREEDLQTEVEEWVGGFDDRDIDLEF